MLALIATPMQRARPYSVNDKHSRDAAQCCIAALRLKGGRWR
jgi:hypothetical protein